MCEGLAKGAQLVAQQVVGGATAPGFTIVAQEPPAGAAVPIGSVVTITVSPVTSGGGGKPVDWDRVRHLTEKEDVPLLAKHAAEVDFVKPLNRPATGRRRPDFTEFGR
ncbi:MAG: PASTA domain-containing protein [Micropruina sp.]